MHFKLRPCLINMWFLKIRLLETTLTRTFLCFDIYFLTIFQKPKQDMKTKESSLKYRTIFKYSRINQNIYKRSQNITVYLRWTTIDQDRL